MRKKRILVVDDEKSMGFLLTEELGPKYDADSCLSGADALEKFSKEQPDLVITDFKMPGMNGSELTQKMKSINSKTPVIMLTGTSPFPESQADETLAKPLSIEELLASVNKFLNTSFSPTPA